MSSTASYKPKNNKVQTDTDIHRKQSRKQKSTHKKGFIALISDTKNQLKVILRLQRFVLKAVGPLWLVYYGLILLASLVPIASSWFFAQLINSLISSVKVGYITTAVWLNLVLLGLFYIYRDFLGRNGVISKWLERGILWERFWKYMQLFKYKQIKDVRIEVLEDPSIAEGWKLIEKYVSPSAMWRMTFTGINVIKDLFTIISVAMVLLFKQPFLFVIVLFLNIPFLYHSFKRTQDNKKMSKYAFNLLRRGGMAMGNLENSHNLKYAKELGIVNYLLVKFGPIWNFPIDTTVTRNRYWYLKKLPFDYILNEIANILVLFLLVMDVVQKKINIGNLTFYYDLTQQVLHGFWSLTSDLGLLSEQIYFLNRFFDFWEKDFPTAVQKYLTNTNTKQSIRVSTLKDKNIIVKNLKYKYPTAKSYALKGVNLQIPYGSNIAIVGQNGAGKSTFLKILLGHYTSYKGSLKLGEYEVKQYDYNSYLSRFSILPQAVITTVWETVYDTVKIDFENRKYIGKNLTPEIFSAYTLTKSRKRFEEIINNMFNDKYTDVWEDVFKKLVYKSKASQKVIDVLKQVGLYNDVKKFPKGLFTYLSTGFKDGVSLSRGQWQRLHIARILYDPGDILILDEPTSAIDPLASFKLIDLIFEKFKDRTVIVVSHRYSTIAKADYIYVFDNGKVVEQGTHKELIKKNGYYAKAYKEEVERLKG